MSNSVRLTGLACRFLQSLRQWWASTNCIEGLDEQLAGRVRAYQLRGLFKINVLMVPTTLLTALVVAITFWDQSPRSVIVWLFAIFYFFAVQVDMLVRRGRRPPASATERGIKGAERSAIWLAFVWGSVPLLFSWEAEPGQHFLLATITTGTLCVGSLALATVPRAAIIYAVLTVVLLSASLAAAPTGNGLAAFVILIILLATICGTVVTFGQQASRHVVDQQLIAHAAAEQKRLREAMIVRELRARTIVDRIELKGGSRAAA
jgi:hypothetical protein